MSCGKTEPEQTNQPKTEEAKPLVGRDDCLTVSRSPVPVEQEMVVGAPNSKFACWHFASDVKEGCTDNTIQAIKAHKFVEGPNDFKGKFQIAERDAQPVGDTYKFEGLNITIPRGQTHSVCVQGTVDSVVNDRVRGGFEIVDSSDITVSPKANIRRAFPAKGPVHTFVTGKKNP